MRAAQKPTFERVGAYDDTDGQEATMLASEYFGDAIPWQQHVIDVMLALGANDKYRFHNVALSVPRQNGKSWIVRARCFYGALMRAEKILYTCQHGDTADEMFSALSAPFEDEENYELQEMYAPIIRKTNGQQAIKLANGGIIRFTTRTNSLARGRSFDVIIYDEAQELTRAQQAASRPAISASKTKNTQVIYLGTPPNETAGDVFLDLHDRIHASNKKGTAWMEWGYQQDTIPLPNERKNWYDANPSLGTILDLTAVEGESEDMDALDFARERLGWWSPRAQTTRAINLMDWNKTKIPEIANHYQGVCALGIKFSIDGESYVVVGCKARKNKSAYAFERIEAGTTAHGTRKLAEALAARATSVSVIVIDGKSGASALCENLKELGVPKGYVVRPRTQDIITCAQGLCDMLANGKARHTEDSALDAGARDATKRPIGNQGGWGIDGSISLEAASLALWGARITKRDPKRKQVILS